MAYRGASRTETTSERALTSEERAHVGRELRQRAVDLLLALVLGGVTIVPVTVVMLAASLIAHKADWELDPLETPTPVLGLWALSAAAVVLPKAWRLVAISLDRIRARAALGIGSVVFTRGGEHRVDAEGKLRSFVDRDAGRATQPRGSCRVVYLKTSGAVLSIAPLAGEAEAAHADVEAFAQALRIRTRGLAQARATGKASLRMRANLLGRGLGWVLAALFFGLPALGLGFIAIFPLEETTVLGRLLLLALALCATLCAALPLTVAWPILRDALQGDLARLEGPGEPRYYRWHGDGRTRQRWTLSVGETELAISHALDARLRPLLPEPRPIRVYHGPRSKEVVGVEPLTEAGDGSS